jgi:hypothetical protein
VEHPVCDVCGRTLLKGEQLHEYVSSQGQRFGVCVLCRADAEASGWIAAERYGTIAHEPPRRARRGEALRRRLAAAVPWARAKQRKGRPEIEPGGDRAAPADAEPRPAAAATAEAAPARSQGPEGEEARPGRPRPPERRDQGEADGEAAPRTPRPRRGPEAIIRRAVECFNSSQEPRKVAGLIRSLGEPRAAVLPDPSRQLALVTVAWELSWYQWEVSAEGDHESVREVAKGKEVSELSEGARAWNAAVAEDGGLRLRAAGRSRQPSAREA